MIPSSGRRWKELAAGPSAFLSKQSASREAEIFELQRQLATVTAAWDRGENQLTVATDHSAV